MTSDDTSPIACAPWLVPAADACLWLAWTKEASLSHALWARADEAMPDDIADTTPLADVPEPIARMFTRYFAGEPVDPAELPVAPAGSPFQLKVWHALRAIRRGDVRSYAGIAADI